MISGNCVRDRQDFEITASASTVRLNLSGIGQEANGGGAFRLTKGVSDLNRKWRFAPAPPAPNARAPASAPESEYLEKEVSKKFFTGSPDPQGMKLDKLGTRHCGRPLSTKFAQALGRPWL